MATEIEVKADQEGIEDSDIDYYDILVIGRTGMGKSTTADKLVIANLTGADYTGEQYSDEVVEGERMKMSNLSMWLIPVVKEEEIKGETERVTKRLKGLVMSRALEKPHQEVNNFYQTLDEQTNHCQLISNETTKIRTLDVPGFFGDRSNEPEDSELTTAERAITAGLGIMREILCIQATMRMNFKRILYFIPDRGALVRSHKNLEMELELMVHFFGKSIFDCMVLIATVPPEVYEFLPPDVVPFSHDSEVKTGTNFQRVLSRVLPDEKLPDDKPPIVFISMNNSCEDIYKNIKDAPVIFDGVRLAFDSRTCSRCAIKAKFLREKGEKVACYMGEDPSRSIPYNESLCHPMVVSKYWKITKIVGGIAHFITRKKYLGKWPDFQNPDDQVCIHCKQCPGKHGCLKINTLYEVKGEKLPVDHSCNPNEKIDVKFANDPQEVAVDMEN